VQFLDFREIWVGGKMEVGQPGMEKNGRLERQPFAARSKAQRLRQG